MIAVENMETLQRNGFEINIKEGDEHRLKLVAQPVSGKTNFDMKGSVNLSYLILALTRMCV